MLALKLVPGTLLQHVPVPGALLDRWTEETMHPICALLRNNRFIQAAMRIQDEESDEIKNIFSKCVNHSIMYSFPKLLLSMYYVRTPNLVLGTRNKTMKKKCRQSS